MLNGPYPFSRCRRGHEARSKSMAIVAKTLGLIVAITTAVATLSSSVEGQVTTCVTPDCGALEAAELANLLRTDLQGGSHGSFREALMALIQARRAYAEEDLGMLADTIMTVGIDFASQVGADGQPIGVLAANVLVTVSTWRADSGVGIPYPPAAERVVELAHRVPGGSVGLLGEVRAIIGEERWEAELVRFATSDLEPSAARAIAELERSGTDGVAALRELYRDSEVTEPFARRHLEEIARRHGWGR